MSKKYVFSMWVYHHISEFTPDEMEIWKECGMNVPCSPVIQYGKDDPALLIPWLDKARELGMELIASVHGLGYDTYIKIGREEYTNRVKELLAVIGDHPALHGFLVGDEPSNRESLEAACECIKIHKELAPHLNPFLNYTGSMAHFSKDVMGGRTLAEWMKYVKEETGTEEICFDVYDQAINDGGGKTMFFETVKRMVEAAKAAKTDIWGCLLSSPGHVYKEQKEVDLRWQVHMAAVLGLRGVLWFRFYDRAFHLGSYGSPIDEFGYKTEAYYGILRTQRRFTNHFGDLFMRINHKKTYSVTLDRGVFPIFKEGDHDLINGIRADDETIVSFFEDENGEEYLAIANSEWRHYGVVRIKFDETKCRIYDVTQNGAALSGFASEELSDEGVELVLHPAGIRVLKIERI